MDEFDPFLNKLKGVLSNSLYMELEDVFVANDIDNNEFYFVEGMKLAMSIMERKYIPKIWKYNNGWLY